MGTWGLGEGIFRYFEPLYLQELGADPLAIGGILGFIGLAMASAHIPAGYLSDRIGRRPMMYLAWILGAVAAFLMAVAPNLLLFVLGCAFYHMTSFVIAPVYSYVTAARGNWSVGRAITFIAASFSAGEILGPLIGGWSGETFGLRANFLIAAVIFVISNLIIFQIRPQPVEAAPKDEPENNFSELLTRRNLGFLLVIFFAMFSMFLPQPLSQNFLQNERGLNLFQIGILLSAGSLGIVATNLVFGQLKARLGFLLSHLTMALFSLLLWLGGGFYSFLAAYFLMGSYKTARTLATAQSRSLIKVNHMGLAYGILETSMSFSAILAPPLAGLLYSLDPSSVYPISFGLIILAFFVSWRFLPHSQAEIGE
jgi:predicted MFS family arabinose efflux permease